MQRSRTRTLVTSALLAALLAASALVAVPVGAVPVTLQTLVVVLIALVCAPGQAAIALGLYLALGIAGAPVFSAARGGIAVFVGPTGGYLAGFALGAVAGAWVRRRLALPTLARDVVAAAAVLTLVYVPGALWLAASSGTTIRSAFVGGVAPFVLLDAFKAAAAIAVASALRAAGLADTPPGTARV